MDGPDGLIAIEAKSAPRWDARWSDGLQKLRAAQPKLVRRLYGVFDGARPLVADGAEVLPWRTLLQKLWAGDLVW